MAMRSPAKKMLPSATVSRTAAVLTNESDGQADERKPDEHHDAHAHEREEERGEHKSPEILRA